MTSIRDTLSMAAGVTGTLIGASAARADDGTQLDGVHQRPGEYFARIERDNLELLAVDLTSFER